MIKRHIVETIEEYDNDKNLIYKTTTVTDEEDDNFYGSCYLPPKTSEKSGGCAV